MKTLSILFILYFVGLLQAIGPSPSIDRGKISDHQEGSSGAQEQTRSPTTLQNSRNTMSLPIGWQQKRQRSRRFEVSESRSPSSSSNESDGDSWNITKESKKSKTRLLTQKQVSMFKSGIAHLLMQPKFSLLLATGF